MAMELEMVHGVGERGSQTIHTCRVEALGVD